MFQNSFGDFCNVECGLLRQHKGSIFAPIPLKSVSVVASVVHCVAQVEINQTYANEETTPIEAIYFFPVDSNGAVTHFQAQIGDKIIKGVVKSNEEAKEDYDRAVKNNQTAILGMENKPDIFKVSVGCIQPGTEIQVTIGYTTEVKNDADSSAMRFFIPTTVAPRYVPDTSKNDPKAKELSRIPYTSSSPAPLSIKVIACIQGKLKSVESNTHKITVVEMGAIPEKPSWTKSVITLNSNVTEMDRDFVILVTPEEKSLPRLYSETLANGSTALMAHFIPSFKLEEEKVELIVVIDRSGSMDGDSMEMAKKALELFIHSMPSDCYFNIVSFGSSFTPLFPEGSRKYNEETLAIAKNDVQRMSANMGGTEILKPLEFILWKPNITGYSRQLFIITDGQVANTEKVIRLVQNNATRCRAFALGIGSGASHHLVEGIAKAGGGTCAFVESDESIQKQTLGQLKNALQPALNDVKVEWIGMKEPVLNKKRTLFGYNKPLEGEENAQQFFVAPKNIPPIFDGSQLIAFGVFPKNAPTSVKITAESPDGPLSLELNVEPMNNLDSMEILHKLAAIKIVRELEMDELHKDEHSIGKDFKKEIIRISVENCITSKYTSFIAVDEKSNEKEEKYWTMQTRYVPSTTPAGYLTAALRRSAPSFGGITPGGLSLQMCGSLATSFSFGGGGARCGRVGSTRSTYASHITPVSSNSNVLFGSASAPLHQKLRSKRRSATKRARTPTLGFRCRESRESPDSDGEVGFAVDDDADDQPQWEGDVESLSSNAGGNVAAAREDDKLFQLIKLQDFQGFFKLDEELARTIGKDLEQLRKECADNGWNEIAWASALAVNFFMEKLPQKKVEWELVVKKAMKQIIQNHWDKKEMMDAAKKHFK